MIDNKKPNSFKTTLRKISGTSMGVTFPKSIVTPLYEGKEIIIKDWVLLDSLPDIEKKAFLMKESIKHNEARLAKIEKYRDTGFQNCMQYMAIELGKLHKLKKWLVDNDVISLYFDLWEKQYVTSIKEGETTKIQSIEQKSEEQLEDLEELKLKSFNKLYLIAFDKYEIVFENTENWIQTDDHKKMMEIKEYKKEYENYKSIESRIIDTKKSKIQKIQKYKENNIKEIKKDYPNLDYEVISFVIDVVAYDVEEFVTHNLLENIMENAIALCMQDTIDKKSK